MFEYLKTNNIFYLKIPCKRYTVIQKSYFINLFNKTNNAFYLKLSMRTEIQSSKDDLRL